MAVPPSDISLGSSELHEIPHIVKDDAAQYDDERPIWIYIDDSNIWITAKKLAAKKMKTKEALPCNGRAIWVIMIEVE